MQTRNSKFMVFTQICYSRPAVQSFRRWHTFGMQRQLRPASLCSCSIKWDQTKLWILIPRPRVIPRRDAAHLRQGQLGMDICTAATAAAAGVARQNRRLLEVE